MRVQPGSRDRRRWRAQWPQWVAVVVAALVALAPVAEAFCAIDLPLADGPSPLAQAATSDPAPDGHDTDPCCEHAASLVALQDNKVDDPAAPARTDDRAFVLAAPAFQPAFLPVPRAPARTDPPPAPEPRFLRLKRLLN
ncbi:MAG: hypothetical protein ACM36B_14990 [Bacteroidota bacterium]